LDLLTPESTKKDKKDKTKKSLANVSLSE
jgi:hypothetical protein